MAHNGRYQPVGGQHLDQQQNGSPRSRNFSYGADDEETVQGQREVTIEIPMKKLNSNSSGKEKNNSSDSTMKDDTDIPLVDEKSRGLAPFQKRGGRRKKLEERGLEKNDHQDGTLNVIGRFYHKVYQSAVPVRYFVYVAPLAAVLAIPIIVGATSKKNATIGGVRIVWFFAWIEVLWVSLWVSKLVAKTLPYVFQALAGVVSSGTRKYALVLRNLEIPLSLVGWSICSLSTFVPIMTLNPESRATATFDLKPWQSIMKNILFACVCSSLILLGEKIFIQIVSISYHRDQFDLRIAASKENIRLLSLLYDASRKLFPAYCMEFAEEDYMISDVLNLARGGKHSAKRSGAVTPARLIQNAARVGEQVTAAFGNVAHEVTGKNVLNPTSAHSIVVHALEKKHSTEALARRIWMSFVLEGRDGLYPEDILDVLGIGQENDAEEAFNSLDVDGNGSISLDEMTLKVNEISRERYAIANSMHDVDQAIGVLDAMLMTIVAVVVVFVFVAWLNSSFVTTLATAGTAILSLSFVFAATAQEVLGSCIFLFVKHPFDVGDRVDISDKHFIVERISLLYTVFRTVEANKRSQVPNIVLNTVWIDNITRSKAMRELITLSISFDTSMEDIELLRNEMQKFVRDGDNARDFQKDLTIDILGTSDMSKLDLRIELRHKSNWANDTIRAARRSKFMCALALALKRVPINAPGGGSATAGDKANPTYSVTLTDEQANKNKEAYAADQDKARMNPLHPESHLTVPDSATSTSFDQETSALNRRQSKEAAAASKLVQRDVIHESLEESELERKRTNDINELRGILRRSSSTGRRKPSRYSSVGGTLVRQGTGIPNVPIIAEPRESGGFQQSRFSTRYTPGGASAGSQQLPPSNLRTSLDSELQRGDSIAVRSLTSVPSIPEGSRYPTLDPRDEESTAYIPHHQQTQRYQPLQPPPIGQQQQTTTAAVLNQGQQIYRPPPQQAAVPPQSNTQTQLPQGQVAVHQQTTQLPHRKPVGGDFK